jgi:hypothetical protein
MSNLDHSVLQTFDLVGAGAADKVVTGSASVGDGTSVLAVGVEDNTVSAGGATGVDAVALDGELLVRAADGEVEALVVVVLVTVDGNAWLARWSFRAGTSRRKHTGSCRCRPAGRCSSS